MHAKKIGVITLLLLAMGWSAFCRNAHAHAATTPPGHPLTADDAESWLDGYMPYALRTGDIAGAVVVIVNNGQVLVEKGYGYADVANRTRVDPKTTLFRFGSVSKLFTWTAVMQLVEQGKIDLDADVNQYLDFAIPLRDGQPVTMRNIMTHTAGFEERLTGLIGVGSDGVVPLGDFLKEYIPPRIFAPGKTPAYSNYGAALAGYIVARVSGRSFDDYLDQNLFAPLEMANSTFRQPLPTGFDSNLSKAYSAGSLPAKPFEIVGPAPAGSLTSTGDDMSHFMIAHLQMGRYGSNRILKPETSEQMHTTALTILPGVNRMLLGFYEDNYNGHRVIAHGGDTQWFHSDLHLFIDDGVGLLVSMNSLGKDGAAQGIRSLLFHEFSNRYLPGPSVTSTVDGKTAADHARMIAGRYEGSRRAETTFVSLLYLLLQPTVSNNGDGTVSVSTVTSPSGIPLQWREIAPFLWREDGSKDLLAGRVADGRVVRLSYGEYAPIEMFDRVAWSKSSAWWLPVLAVSLGALVLTGMAWPLGILIRRHYRVAPPLPGPDVKAQRLVRIACVATAVVFLSWAAVVLSMTSVLEFISKLNGCVMLLRVLSPFVFLGGAGIGLWNAWVVLNSQRRWYAKLWCFVLALSLLVLLWAAFAFHLISFSSGY
jgi:CubicO group peptidase (beta-lactamase class C family)